MYVQTSTFVLAGLCIFVSFGGSFGYYSSYNSYDSSYNTKLNDIAEKLDVLTNEVSRLADANAESEDTELAALDPVVIVSVGRQPGPDGNIFTVNCSKNFQEVFYEVYVQDYLTTFGSLDGEKGGLSSFSFTCDGVCVDETKFEIALSNKVQSSGLEIQLDNNSTVAIYQNRFTVPELTYEHSGDLVYYNGRNVSVMISASYGDEKGFSDVRRVLSGFREGWGHYAEVEGSEVIAKSEGKQFLETKETLLTVRSSTKPMSGFLDLSLRFDDENAFLVKQTKVTRSIIVRPFDQSGPFPDDFVDFKDTSKSSSYFQNNQEIHCEIGKNCTFNCVAVGNAITSMDVKQLQGPYDPLAEYYIANYVDEDQLWEDVTDTSELTYEYSRALLWTAHFSADANDSRFKCTAMTASQNTSQKIDVRLVSEEFFIDEERSGIEMEIDEEDPATRNVTVRCTVVGRPLTGAHVQLLNAEEHVYYRYPMLLSTNIVPLGPSENEMSATVKFQFPYQAWNGDFTRAKCKAYSVQSRQAQLTLDMADADQ